ncbi:alpha/beta fold hydrolase [Natrarchaeobaculum aegyptiacum]|uniref:Alpha/beta hydrolase n=1 Tax=Natrarchaeobaculum aegyptiacum TaxID=745377 RepID=A0A2Z2HQW2_9EURY|nr:alpha/beta hydrolase [Natrarchaeobaculum aegyptiacum]ARS89536.1 alpha/beta hydrolase [Natrarchaeobaculum aegyptiacum]
METVTHHGRATAYRVTDEGGDGPPICFVHGSGGTGETWVGQRDLADRYPVVTMDLSGHGDSDDVDAEPGAEALEAYVEDVCAVLEATGARVVVGFSLGGAVALQVLLERDVDLEAAVLTSTGAKLAVLPDLLEWLAEDFDRALEFVHDPGRLFVDPDAEGCEAARAEMTDTGRAVTRRDFVTCDRFDVRGRLAEIDVPVLALAGEEDQLTPPAYHEYLVEEVDDARLETIPDGAHMVMREHPEAFNDAVAAFLADVTGDDEQ